jgi:hypothetical protein
MSGHRPPPYSKPPTSPPPKPSDVGRFGSLPKWKEASQAWNEAKWKVDEEEIRNYIRETPSVIDKDGKITIHSEGDIMIREPGSSENIDPGVIRATLFKMQLALGDTDGLNNEQSSAFSDAEFFIKEAIEALNKVIE